MTGLVLSGGGTAGAYQAGVLYGLFKSGMQVDHIYGVSIGSLNAAILSYEGPDALFHYWCEKEWTAFDFFRPTLTGWFLRGGVCDMSPMKKNLDVIFGSRKARTSFTVTSVHLETGDLVHIDSRTATREELKRGIMASAALPMICEPVDKRVDGAVRDNANVKHALTQGHDEIVVVSCNPLEVQPIETKKRLSVFEVGKRALYEMMLTEYFREDLSDRPSVNVSVYSPLSKQKILNFSRSNLKKQFQLGFLDARRGARSFVAGSKCSSKVQTSVAPAKKGCPVVISSLGKLKDGK